MVEEQDVQNLEEIISLCKDEIDNNKNISATLDLEDLKSLSSVLNRYKAYRKQLNDAFNKGFIHKDNLKEKTEESQKEKYCIKFIYRILTDKRVFNRFCCTCFGNVEEDKTVRLKDCIDYIVKKFEELDVKEE